MKALARRHVVAFAIVAAFAAPGVLAAEPAKPISLVEAMDLIANSFPGQVIAGHPIVGAWLGTALACAALCWMLQAWLPPRWALLGGLLAALHPTILEWGEATGPLPDEIDAESAFEVGRQER